MDNFGNGDCRTAVQYLRYMVLMSMSVLMRNLSSFSTDKSVSVRLVIVKLLPEHSVIVNTQFINNYSWDQMLMV